MQESLKNQLARRLHVAIRKALTRSTDPIVITEQILEVVEMEWDIATEEVGIASVPEALRGDDAPFDIQRASPARQGRDFTPPPPSAGSVIARPVPRVMTDQQPEKRLIVLPGEVTASPDSTEEERKIVTATLNRRPMQRRGSNIPDPEYWSYETLIAAINENSPDRLEFDTQDREGRSRHIVVERNVQAQMGQGNVLLTYKHEKVSDSLAGAWLTAQVPFNLNQKALDFTAALDNIKKQLLGMYAPKPESLEPTVMGPEKSLHQMLSEGLRGGGMGGSHDEHMTGGMNVGGRNVVRGADGFYHPADATQDSEGNWRHGSNPLEDVKRKEVARENDGLAPAGRRF